MDKRRDRQGAGTFQKDCERGDGEAGEEVSSYGPFLALQVLAWQHGRHEEGLLGCLLRVGKVHHMALWSILGPHSLRFEFLSFNLNFTEVSGNVIILACAVCFSPPGQELLFWLLP